MPFWWVEHQMLDLGAVVDNRAVVTVGQLKNIATKSREYLNQQFDFSAGEWDDAFNPNPFPFSEGQSPENSKIATIGQAKFLASGFYNLIGTRLHYNMHRHYQRLGVYDTEQDNLPRLYPWRELSTADNRSVLLQGQLKVMFGFDLSAGAVLDPAWERDHAGRTGRVTLTTDSNNNGVPDYMDADPFNDRMDQISLGVLTISITEPVAIP